MPELLIIGLVVVLLFGVGKVGRLGKDLGEGIKEFRRAMKDEDGVDVSAPPVVEQPYTAQLPVAPTAVAQRFYPPPQPQTAFTPRQYLPVQPRAASYPPYAGAQVEVQPAQGQTATNIF